MKTYEFTIQLNGVGETVEEAWVDACEHLVFHGEDEYYMPEEKDYKLIDKWDDE